MHPLNEAIHRYMLLIFFAYGLAFFTMGAALAVHSRRRSGLHLSRSLWMLAAFGLIHGAADWGYVFIPIYDNYLSASIILDLKWARQALTGISFSFLFFFGAKLLSETRRKYGWLPLVPVGIYLGWFLRFVPDGLALGPNGCGEWWLEQGDIWSRYLLALPGSIITAWALWSQNAEFEYLNADDASAHLKGASIAMLVYGVADGLLVPEAAFFPASVINTTRFFMLTGLPVQVLRGFTGLLMAYLLIRTTEIFDVEIQKEIDEARRTEAIIRERDRISRDLHDGIIQSIYGAALNLTVVDHLVESDPGRARSEIEKVKLRLNEVIEDIRGYIQDLQSSSFEPRELKAGIQGVLEEFKSKYDARIETYMDVPVDLKLPLYVLKHVYHILREALNNVVRHSNADKVRLTLEMDNNILTCTVEDDGIGFEPQKVRLKSGVPGHHEGLGNMYERARAIDGTLEIDSSPGKGTRITLRFPCER